MITAAANGLQGAVQTGVNAWSAQQQMEFQRNMASTSHQREVSDLKAAGLNPILSVNKGAAVPGGASFQADIPPIANSAYAAALTKAQTLKTLAEANSAQAAAEVDKNTVWNLIHQREADLALKSNQVYKSDVESDSPVLKGYRQSLMDSYSQIHSAATAAALNLPEAQLKAKGFQAGNQILDLILGGAKKASFSAASAK